MIVKLFIQQLRAEVLEQNLRLYDEILKVPLSTVTDPQWRRIRSAYDRLDPEQRDAVRVFVRQAVSGTLSNLLGILDGSSLLSGFREYFSLQYGFRKEKLNGSLQDEFLSGE